MFSTQTHSCRPFCKQNDKICVNTMKPTIPLILPREKNASRARINVKNLHFLSPVAMPKRMSSSLSLSHYLSLSLIILLTHFFGSFLIGFRLSTAWNHLTSSILNAVVLVLSFHPSILTYSLFYSLASLYLCSFIVFSLFTFSKIPNVNLLWTLFVLFSC